MSPQCFFLVVVANKSICCCYFADNPSYFTMAGQDPSPVASASTARPAAGSESGAKPKRFKNWFKLSSNKSQAATPIKNLEPSLSVVEDDDQPSYYDFWKSPAQQQEADDVFTAGEQPPWTGGSTRTLNNHRRRHSLGSWFRFSLAAAVRKHNETENRPSTSSERALLPRNVSTSANCVSYRYFILLFLCEGF